jgi:hypothetical protein
MTDLTRLREIARASRPRREGPDPAADRSGSRGEDGGVRSLVYDYGNLDADRRLVGPGSDPRAGLTLEGSRLVETSAGPCLVVEHRIDADRHHGMVRVGEAEVHDDDALAVLGRWTAREGAGPGINAGGAAAPGAETPGTVLFLDLETTGLSGGAGTVAFLVGIGFFDRGAFHTRQFFLTSYQGERALLEAVAGSLGPMGRLVTYNGKSFDVPVMETRWLFQRMRPPFEGVPHLDLLHPARRLWRDDDDGLGQSCRLVALEQSLLRFHRIGDVPGWEIPARYFDYIRHGATAPLEPVLLHNRLDLLSLALLTARAQRLVREGAAGTIDPREWLAIGCLLERAGQDGRAEECFERASTARVTGTALRVDALRRLGRLRRRQRRFVEAADAWRRLLALDRSASRAAQEAREALAVHFEHRERDYATARGLAADALSRAGAPRARDAVSHRLARLDRKLSADGDGVVPARLEFID